MSLPKDLPQPDGSQKTAAERIYQRLQRYKNSATLEGFGEGQVFFTDESVVSVGRFDTSIDFEREMLLENGFTQGDVQSGVVTLRDRLPAEPQRTFIISGTGRVLEHDIKTNGFKSSSLEGSHVAALSHLNEIGLIPQEITNRVGSYDAFRAALGGNPDLTGINTTDPNTQRRLYRGGTHGSLFTFVRGTMLPPSWQERDTSISSRFKDSLEPENRAVLPRVVASLRRRK